MTKTKLDIDGKLFRINGKQAYSEIDSCPKDYHGMLMNARFIQGIFDDRANPRQFERFGIQKWDPEENTNHLIAALPQWYQYGLRAFTVGFQGGGPCYTVDLKAIDNNPFGMDGKQIDSKWATRMDRVIKAADQIGMIVIVSFFYPAQIIRLKDDNLVDCLLDAVLQAAMKIDPLQKPVMWF